MTNNHECRAGKTCEERPETEWGDKIALEIQKEIPDLTLAQAIFLIPIIERHIQAAEQRGFERGNFQCKRLYENNQLLQKKLREGNRELLEQVMFEISTLNNPDYDRPWEDALDAVRDRLKTLLAFQQEPKEI